MIPSLNGAHGEGAVNMLLLELSFEFTFFPSILLILLLFAELKKTLLRFSTFIMYPGVMALQCVVFTDGDASVSFCKTIGESPSILLARGLPVSWKLELFVELILPHCIIWLVFGFEFAH